MTDTTLIFPYSMRKEEKEAKLNSESKSNGKQRERRSLRLQGRSSIARSFSAQGLAPEINSSASNAERLSLSFGESDKSLPETKTNQSRGTQNTLLGQKRSLNKSMIAQNSEFPEFSTHFNDDLFHLDNHLGFSKMEKRPSSSSRRKKNKTAKDKQWWTVEEDLKLKEAVSSCGAKNWKLISEMADVGKSDVQCLQRWTQVLRPGLKKGTWSKDEDKRLTSLVNQHCLDHTLKKTTSIPWKKIEKDMGGRTAKQCRERWKLSLDPSINKTLWSQEEDRRLIALQEEYGNSWSKIKDLLATNRTENAVKLRYKCLKKRQEKFSKNMDHFREHRPTFSHTPSAFSVPQSYDVSLEEGRKRLKLERNLKEKSQFCSPHFEHNFLGKTEALDIDPHCLGDFSAPLDSIFQVADFTTAAIKSEGQQEYPVFERQRSESVVPFPRELPISRHSSSKTALEFEEVYEMLSEASSYEN